MTETAEIAGLPLVAAFVQNGESAWWTPYAIRCRNADSRLDAHPVVYLTPEFYAQQQGESFKYYGDQHHFDCPRCNTMSGGVLLSPEENPRPARVELPVLHDSENAGHRALLAALRNHEWAARSHYFARDLAYWTRTSLECADAPREWAVVVSECGLSLVGRGQFQAPERLGGYLGAQRQYLLFLWDGDTLRETTAEEGLAWILGENENRIVLEPRCKEMAVTLPSCEELLASLPWRLRAAIREHDRQAYCNHRRTFQAYYEYEVMSLLMTARRCTAPVIRMSLFHHASARQWVCDFACSDRGLPRTDQVNWHLQNTSQWRYAGALVIDDQTGELSSHH